MAQSLSRERGLAGPKAAGQARARPRLRRKRWGIWLLPLLLAGLLCLAVVSGVAYFEYRYAGLIYPGVQIAGVPVGGLTLEQAEAAVQDALSPYPGLPVVLQYNDRRWALSPNDLGVTVDSAAAAAQAYAVGRHAALPAAAPARPGDWRGLAQGLRVRLLAESDALQADLAAQWDALRSDANIGPSVRFDDGRVTYQLKRIAQDIDLAPQEGSLVVSGLDVIATPGRVGRELDVEATAEALRAAARAGQGGIVDLVVRERAPVVLSTDAAAAQAKALLSQPLTLVAQGVDAPQRFAVDRATLREWMQITPVSKPDGTMDLKVQVNGKLVEAYLKQIGGQINRAVQEAALDFDPKTKQIKVVTPSRAGQQLDAAAAGQTIEQALAGSQRELQLPVAVIQPTVDSNKVAEMGIQELVSEGSTGFAGSSSGRVKNIINAASKFNNVVIPPGGEFSFNRYVGDVTAANGFVDSLIISGDRTEVGVGGGVCQVSTTAFQAAARGGFPIIERWAHSYVVGYYGKPGLDATIYTPDVDFRFKNDTGHYLLIKTEVNAAKSTVTFRYYGTRPDRTVEISDPKITNVTPPDKPVYQEDKTLPPGTIKQVDWANNGQDVVVVRTIKNGDGTVKEERITSKYQAWRAVFLYGPGAKLPPGAVDAEAPGTSG